MQKCPRDGIRSSWLRPLLILMVGVIGVLLAGLRDFAWTIPMYKDPWKGFSELMGQSIFEGEWPGGSDLGVVVAILAFFFWLHKKYKRPDTNPLMLMHLKFVFLAGLLAPLVSVQSLKWIVSRARPKVYLSEILPKLNETNTSEYLPGFMGLSGPRGYSWNSFPSGHTSTAAVLLVFVYIFGSTPFRRVSIFLSVAGYSFLMAVARSMDGMHWISDSVGSFFIVWAVVDCLYGQLLKRDWMLISKQTSDF